MDEVESKSNYKTKIGILDYHSAVTNTAREDFDAKALPTRSVPPEARGLFLIFAI